MKILAIDPSFSGCGVTYLGENGEENYYLIKADKNSKNSIDITRRIIKIKEEIRLIIKNKNPEYIILEGPSFASKSSSLIQMGALNHILRELFIEENIKFVIAPPKTIKKQFTSNGNADKLEVIEEVMKRGANIPFFKNIKKQKMFDDNVSDSFAMACFLRDLINGKAKDYESKVEKSW